LRFVNDMGGLQNLEKYNFSSNHNFKRLGWIAESKVCEFIKEFFLFYTSLLKERRGHKERHNCGSAAVGCHGGGESQQGMAAEWWVWHYSGVEDWKVFYFF
jgi:hypothetical protein